jgi:hypothetical protein
MAHEVTLGTVRSDHRAGRRGRWSVFVASGAACAAALFGLAHTPVAGADPTTDLDAWEDLHGGGASDWTGALDKFFVSLDPTFAVGEDAGADNFASADAAPFSDLVAAIDPNAFISGAPNPHDLLGVLAVTADYGFGVYDLPALLGPGMDPLVSAFQSSMVALDNALEPAPAAAALDDDPFNDLLGTVDPHVSTDLLGVLAGALDSGLNTIALPFSTDGGVTTVAEPLGFIVDNLFGI